MNPNQLALDLARIENLQQIPPERVRAVVHELQDEIAATREELDSVDELHNERYYDDEDDFDE